MGEDKKRALSVFIDRKLKTETVALHLNDYCIGKKTRHSMLAMLRRSVYGRLACNEDISDAERLRVDLALMVIVSGKAQEKTAASTSEMGRFETEILFQRENVSSLIMTIPAKFVDRTHQQKPLDKLILECTV